MKFIGYGAIASLQLLDPPSQKIFFRTYSGAFWFEVIGHATFSKIGGRFLLNKSGHTGRRLGSVCSLAVLQEVSPTSPHCSASALTDSMTDAGSEVGEVANCLLTCSF